MTKKKITAEIVAHWGEEELFTALQKNQESKSANWEQLVIERNIIESELARRAADEENCTIERIDRTFLDWGLFHPDQTGELTWAQQDELRDVAYALNNAFYFLVLNVPDHKNLPYTRVSAILDGFAAFGAADSEGFSCAARLLCEYYGAPQAYEQWRYPLMDIRQLRKEAKLSMHEAGQLINVSLATINRWEHGQLGNPALVAVYCDKLEGIIEAKKPVTV